MSEDSEELRGVILQRLTSGSVGEEQKMISALGGITSAAAVVSSTSEDDSFSGGSDSTTSVFTNSVGSISISSVSTSMEKASCIRKKSMFAVLGKFQARENVIQ